MALGALSPLRHLALAFVHHYHLAPELCLAAASTDIRGRPTDAQSSGGRSSPSLRTCEPSVSPYTARSVDQANERASECKPFVALLTNRSRSLGRTRAMNFFKTKPRTPSELVRGLRDAILKLDGGQPGGDTRRKVRNDLSLARFTLLISLTRLARISPRVLHRSRPSYLVMEVRAHPRPTFIPPFHRLTSFARKELICPGI
jgi:hypothetical protein